MSKTLFFPRDGLALVLLSVAVLVALWHFALPSMSPVNPAALVDLRRNPTARDYSILFVSRTTGLQGHAYVVWVAHPQSGIYRAEGLGFYAKGDLTRMDTLFGGQGEIVNEFERASGPSPAPAHTVVAWVDKDQFDISYSLVERWRGPAVRYSLFQSDCLTLLYEIAAALGVRAPHRIPLMTPDRYVRALIEANTEVWVKTTMQLTGR